MSYPEVLALPLRTFWAFNRQVDRLRAEAELRQLSVAIAARAEAEGPIREMTTRLREEMGTPVLVEKTFDEAKFEELRNRFGKKETVSDSAAAPGSS